MVATGWGAKTPAELDEMGMPEWVIDGILPKECAGVVFATSGVGKTFFVLGMACAIATGTDWYGHAVKQGGVLYVAAEGYRGIRQRQRAWETYHGVILPDTLRVTRHRVNLQDEDEVAAFIAWVKENYPDVRLVVFDTLSKCMPRLDDENGNADMAKAVAGADAIMHALHAAVVLGAV
jgi:RecA-family ATPase